MVPRVVRSCFVSAAAAWMSGHHAADALHRDRPALPSPRRGIDEAALAAPSPDESAQAMPRHQGLSVQFVRQPAADLHSALANISLEGLKSRYSVEEMQEMRPTDWERYWTSDKCLRHKAFQTNSTYFLECTEHRPIVWSPTHKLGYMKTAKAASTAFAAFFYQLFEDANETFDARDVPDDVFVFTFVREPFEHKLAAFAEVDLKTVDGAEQSGLDDSTFFQHVQVGNQSAYARFWVFLDDVRFKRFQSGDARKPEHAGNQIAAALCERTPDYIGHLERLHADWDMIQELANLTTSMRTKALPIVHADTSDEHPLYRDDEHIVMDHELQKKICRQYRSEFACLGYYTPRFCRKFVRNAEPLMTDDA